MKKRKKQSKIPQGIYCDGCPYHRIVWWDTTETVERCDGDYSMYIDPEGAKKMFEGFAEHPFEHKKEECQFRDNCKDDCSQCKQPVAYCEYLHYREYGVFPLFDGIKLCNIKIKEKR